MTTTVKRGAGRPAAAARTAKAAQRTPLPAENTADNLDGLSLGELRKIAVAKGWSTATRANKAGLLKILREHPDGPPATVAARSRSKSTPRPESHPERRASSGQGKAARLTEALKPFGWDVKTKVGPGDRVEATAKRGAETLRLVWVDGGYNYGVSALKSGSSSRKLRNLSEAIRLCAVEADAG